jgi:hypothetical protein
LLVFCCLCRPSLTATTLYVDVNNLAPAAPYTAWTNAATSIQDAVDVAGLGDEIVVTNGVYQTGGRVVSGALTNRVAVTNAVTVRVAICGCGRLPPVSTLAQTPSSPAAPTWMVARTSWAAP